MREAAARLMQLLQVLVGVLTPHGLLVPAMLCIAVVHGAAGLVGVIVVLACGHMQVAVVRVALAAGRVRHQRCHRLLAILRSKQDFSAAGHCQAEQLCCHECCHRLLAILLSDPNVSAGRVRHERSHRLLAILRSDPDVSAAGHSQAEHLWCQPGEQCRVRTVVITLAA